MCGSFGSYLGAVGEVYLPVMYEEVSNKVKTSAENLKVQH
jgi:hypothetical protein